MTEYEAQNFLYHYANIKAHTGIATNIYLYAWESDIVSVTKAGYVYEYEIKLSMADFKKDFDKKEKHQTLKNGWRDLKEFELGWLNNQYFNNNEMFRQRLTSDKKLICSRPNYFFYACPDGLIKESETPNYAGLLYLNDRYYDNIIKKMPLLHRDKITEKQKEHIINSFQFKYWNLRLNKSNNELAH